MKLLSVPFLSAVMGLAALQASASPIRIVTLSVSSSQPLSKLDLSHFRIGMAGAFANSPIPIKNSSNLFDTFNYNAIPHKPVSRPMRGCKIIGDWVRQKFGWTPDSKKHFRLIPAHRHHSPDNHGNDEALRITAQAQVVSHHHGWVPITAKGRLQKALMTLGPWEGRAVAFVLGCGIGTLLRMLYVLAVVCYRSFRQGNTTDDDEVDIVFEEVEELSSPPAYPLDEKIVPVEGKHLAA